MLCGCAAQRVHGRPCRHLLRYNDGLVEVEDFAYFHTKKYLATAYDAPVFAGVVDRAPSTRELPEYAMPASQQTGDDDVNNCEIGEGDGSRLPKKRKNRAYSSCERQFKHVLTKWGNNPSILQQFCKMVADHDAELGDVELYTYSYLVYP